MKEINRLDAKTLEIHYWLDSQSHAVDAHSFYTCQQELVTLIEYVAKQFNVDIRIETVALGEGGVKAWLRTNGVNLIAVPLFVTIVGNIMSAAPSEAIGTLVNHWITEYIKSPEVKNLERLRIEKESQILQKEIDSIKSNGKKFNEKANTCSNLEKVSFEQKENENQCTYFFSKTVCRDKFPSYIIESAELDPIENENAIIEIVAPVLKNSKQKWKGIYHKQGISFKMSDHEFQKDVFNRKVSFSNGSVIHCSLLEKKKVNNKGEIVTYEYEVLEVNSMSINGTPQEIPAKRRKQVKVQYKMPSLFDD